ncbi:endonuclease [Coprobacter tertius]|uniref:Endonuclease n=1 Tax=Coprobacter tertius TaxID=2944915 RepID=A0ABT1MJ25_9BACT|nr:endonuclease [Coprobacter tertius]MCP9612607.1 endonuclease [Coprobacter tertius]
MKRHLLNVILFFVSLSISAQIPDGYYESAVGKADRELKTAMGKIVFRHTELTYKELWSAFDKTDLREDGKIWDMYSSLTNYTFQKNQCGNYKKEGDCYNREHSFPKSWFNDEYPMYTDLNHLYPTDGKVNGMRGNDPFGEVGSSATGSYQNFSRWGACIYPGYSGDVFEPNDIYKGDFARTYFYMVTCYEDYLYNWSSDMLDGTAYPAFTEWAMNMLLEWSREDPVSKKEIDRNNAVYKIQGNRNPFIDYPQLAEYIWGNKKGEDFDGSSSVNVEFADNLSVYVASGNVLTIVDAPEGSYLQIFDLSGRAILGQRLWDGLNELTINSSGIYIVKVKTPLRVYTTKIIIP